MPKTIEIYEPRSKVVSRWLWAWLTSKLTNAKQVMPESADSLIKNVLSSEISSKSRTKKEMVQ